jgi:Holliday junction resolvase RusA-like endonuclease
MDVLEFKTFYPFEPVAKERARVTRSGFAFTPKKTLQAEYDLKYHIFQARPKKFDRDMALSLTLEFYFIKPKSVPKKRLFPTVKPDLDNLVKLVCDVMNKLVYWDDAQIIDLHVKKRYSDKRGIGILCKKI